MIRVGDRVQVQGACELDHKGTVIEIEAGEFSIISITVRWDNGKVQPFYCDEHREIEQGKALGYDVLEVVTPRLYVNVYLWDREFGGPEEGGWWYDSYTPVPEECTLLPTEAEADVFAADKQAWAEKENRERRHPNSVLSEGYFVVVQEAWPAERSPRYRPQFS